MGGAEGSPEPVERGPRLSSAYKDALAWLYGTQRFGIKLGLVIEPSLACGLYIRALLLAGMRGLFLCVWP